MKFQELWKEAGFDFSPPFDSPELEYEMNEVDAMKAIDFIKNQGTAATNIICVGSDSDNGKLIDEIKAQEMDGRGYLWAGFDVTHFSHQTYCIQLPPLFFAHVFGENF